MILNLNRNNKCYYYVRFFFQKPCLYIYISVCIIQTNLILLYYYIILYIHIIIYITSQKNLRLQSNTFDKNNFPLFETKNNNKALKMLFKPCFIKLNMDLWINQSIHQSIYGPMDLYIHTSIHQLIYPSIHQLIYQFIHLLIDLSRISLSIHLPIQKI